MSKEGRQEGKEKKRKTTLHPTNMKKKKKPESMHGAPNRKTRVGGKHRERWEMGDGR